MEHEYNRTIMRCPNCSYALIFFERRRKYKCASCQKLFYQKTVEEYNFRVWNIKKREFFQQELGADTTLLEVQHSIYTDEERMLKKSIQNSRWYEANKARVAEYSKKYYKDDTIRRIRQQIRYWKKKQQELVAQKYRNGLLKASDFSF